MNTVELLIVGNLFEILETVKTCLFDNSHLRNCCNRFKSRLATYILHCSFAFYLKVLFILKNIFSILQESHSCLKYLHMIKSKIISNYINLI